MINLKPNARRRGKACQAVGILLHIEGSNRIIGALLRVPLRENNTTLSILALPR